MSRFTTQTGTETIMDKSLVIVAAAVIAFWTWLGYEGVKRL